LLDQASWGPTSDAIAEVRRMGISDWLDWQFSLSESDLPDQPILDANDKPYRNFAPLQAAFFQNAVSGQDQLRQRVAFALSEIWVVSGVTLPRPYAFPPYWRIFRDNAFGNYRDLIKAVTLSPAMGAYLNMANNNKPANGASANENYARELLQLFTIGLTRLNADGTPVLDADRNPAPAYTQADVTNLARAFTGWTYAPAPGVAGRPNNPAYFYGHMIAVQSRHDPAEKTVLGEKLPAGETAEQDLEAVLDILMRQETMAPFICRQLIQHLVTSNPSPDYIRRVSQVFLDDGHGVRGDMQAVTRAILLDPEARSGDDNGAPEPRDFGHLREPVLFVANLLRGLNATAGPENGAAAAAARLGQSLFFPPSVFSYFSPQYRTAGGVGGPEFQIYSTQTASFRANLVNQVLYQALDKLSGFQKKLIYLLFFKDLTQHEAAEELGLNQKKVSRESIKALHRLHTVLGKKVF
jgi:RNA polymerase sigma factor (sigma-70 family)